VSGSPPGSLRLAVYTDYSYRREGGAVFGERAFVLFLAGLARSADQLVILGRLDPRPGRSHYRIPDGVRFVPLPHYESLLAPFRAMLAMLRSLGRFWRALDDVDTVWLLGPYVHSLAFVVLAALRRRRIVLGVRQDTPRYVRSRHPQRRWTHWAASVLDLAWRVLSRRYPIVVVGPDLARRYSRAPRLLTMSVSLVRETDLTSLEAAEERRYDGELRVMAVGRLEPEKNPLLLADVLARLRDLDGRWRLTVCGEGPMAERLARRLAEVGVAEAADLRGYVPIDGGLTDLYRASHAFLHVSLTEGLPAVLFEAFAAGLPVVATAVGGVGEAVGGAVKLVPPGDPEAAAAALQLVAGDEALRRQLISAGLAEARAHTMERETERLAEFLGHPAATDRAG
jgi:glycosyltransferase involved in cell wall biosynthesis